MRIASLVSALVLVTACGGGSSKPAESGGSSGASGSSESASTSSSAAGSSSDSSGSGAGSGAGGGGGGAAGAAPEKMDGALPETKDAKAFPKRAECPKGGCNLAMVVPDVARPAADDKAPIVMWEEVMPPKVMLLMPKVAGLDVYGILLDGEVSVLADDIKDKQKRAWKMNGFHAPGVGINIYSKEPTRILFAAVVNGTSGSVAEQIDKIAKKDKSIGWSKRSAPVTNFELSQKPDIAWGGGAYHARIAYEEPPASMGLLMMSKNAPVAEHTHDKEWEFLAIVDGDGELVKKSGGNVKISGATFVSMPPGVAHAFKPSGTTPTIAVQMYWPPGPEQRFKKLAEGSK